MRGPLNPLHLRLLWRAVARYEGACAAGTLPSSIAPLYRTSYVPSQLGPAVPTWGRSLFIDGRQSMVRTPSLIRPSEFFNIGSILGLLGSRSSDRQPSPLGLFYRSRSQLTLLYRQQRRVEQHSGSCACSLDSCGGIKSTATMKYYDEYVTENEV